MSIPDCITIGVVDNDPLVLQALTSMIADRSTPLHMLWSVNQPMLALDLCKNLTTRPMLVLSDLQIPQMDGKELAEHLQRIGIPVLAMTAFQLTYTTDELMKAGIHAVIRKEAPLQEYVQLIGKILGNDEVAHWQERSLDFQRMMLTDREIEILREYLKGRTTASTARLLHVSEGTVKTHMNNAYRKMGVHSRAEAIRICVKEHIL
ncbi:response regulator transcription factor [Bifidobacterium callitrichos]|uniref:LuxR family transcriptional regulator n=1 Tax=Bifidobacterium callitrichos DSM 23973 TaxID=1437609 RepID=A0A087AD60_9BIFI|nr:response regulator transcription factor [Bifidobacterium callitrichos]KFI56710.1 LuxR family transcriptional regulator [Bifidobacterium callitrichos DSM 23973]